MTRTLSLALLLTTMLAPLEAADTSRAAVIDQTIATLQHVQTFDQVAVAPDGKHLAWVQIVPDKAGKRAAGSGVYVAPFPQTGNPLHVVVAGSGKAPKPKDAAVPEEGQLAWSPDGQRLAFVSDAVGGRAQLYVAGLDGRAVPATEVRGSLAMPKWAPDGKTIAVLFIENASRKGGATVAMTPPSGDIELQIEEQRIAIVDPSARAIRFASAPDMYVYDYDWSPDGRSFVAEAAKGSGADNYWIARLYRFESGSTEAHELYKPELQVASPRWSPDGKSIAFIAGLMSDEGVTGGDIHVIAAGGGVAKNITPGLAASASTLIWSADSSTIQFGEIINGQSGFARVGASGGSVAQLWSGAEKTTTGGMVGLSSSRDGSVTAVIRESFTKPPQIAAGPLGEWTAVTHANDSVQPLWGGAESLNWNSDGYRVQGWLLHPRTEDANRSMPIPVPLVVQIHGGPSSAALSGWPNLNLAALVASGYAVLLPNPRGSYGQGEAFTLANVKDFGRGDFRDILLGTDVAIARGNIDRNRTGVWGWSYGGYMTMWAVTQTDRFRAAVAGAGIFNWESYYGQNSIDQWMIPFFGASVYDDPWIYRRSSPSEFATKVKTPTLVMVGDRDGEVPAPQSFEFWHALKTKGVKTQLIVYPNEGHHFADPEHRRDCAKRTVEWFDRFLTP